MLRTPGVELRAASFRLGAAWNETDGGTIWPLAGAAAQRPYKVRWVEVFRLAGGMRTAESAGVRSPRLGCLLACFGAVAVARGAVSDERWEALWREPVGERVTLSSDGRWLAWTVPEDGETRIATMGLEPLGGRRTVRLPRGDDGAGESGGDGLGAAMPLRFLRWATPGRLVFAPEARTVPLPPVTGEDGRARPNPDGPTVVAPVFAVDADGGRRGTLVEARQFMETPAEARTSLADLLRSSKEIVAVKKEPVGWKMPQLEILGFLPRQRDQLVIATRGAYSMPMQHLVDVTTGSVREFGGAWEMPPGGQAIFDEYRAATVGERRPGRPGAEVWRDAELAQVQREVEEKFPRRTVELLDWSGNRGRVVVRVTGGTDPGRVFVYDRAEGLALEAFRRAPWLKPGTLHGTRAFDFEPEPGAVVRGYLTWPERPRAAAPPLLVLVPDGPPEADVPAFEPEAQVLAELGFAVLRLNWRRAAAGAAGGETASGDAVETAGRDGRAAVAWLSQRFPGKRFDPGQTTAVGRGAGAERAARMRREMPELAGGAAGADMAAAVAAMRG